MALKLYDTMSRRKHELVTRESGKVGMYVCGPTVYNYIHIGNARTFLNFDMVRRYLQFSGYEVTFVQNVTDVDDKIINRANEEGVAPGELADRYREAFEADMAALGVQPPDVAPRATEHIEEMVAVIARLVERGFAYESDGDVYFEVSRYGDYGKLSGRNLDEQRITVQSEEELERKRSPMDFALWKAAKPGEPSWDSPWGPGRPGWHIECSTMSMKYLGSDFDIHGGGQDLVFPHHENEIAQAEAASGERFVRFWMHSGMLNIDLEKMSKSLGNIKRLREVLQEHDADTVRMLMLGSHYRSPLNFSDDSLDEAAASLDRLRNCLFTIDDLRRRAAATETEPDVALEDSMDGALRGFREAMDDDFNSAAALGAVFGLVRDINSHAQAVEAGSARASASQLERARQLIDDLCGALGLFQAGAGEVAETAAPAVGPTREQLIDYLLETRQRARELKAFELADGIRDWLTEAGVRVDDTRDGFRWRFEQ